MSHDAAITAAATGLLSAGSSDFPLISKPSRSCSNQIAASVLVALALTYSDTHLSVASSIPKLERKGPAIAQQEKKRNGLSDLPNIEHLDLSLAGEGS